MNIFQIDAGKEWRGGQRQSLFLAKELWKKSYPFRLYVQPGSPLHKKALDADLPVIALKMRSETDAWAILRLAGSMKRFSCSLVHCHDAHSAAVGSASASLARVPLRVISRNVDFPIKKNFLSQMKYTKNIDVIIAVSEGIKKVLVDGGIHPGLIKVIPDGIDYSPFEEAASSQYLRRELNFGPEDFLVGIVAHLADHKGHKFLIKATEILKEKAPRIKVIIVGEGPLRMELDKLVKQTRVEDMVFFLGFREDVPQILASLDLFVLSSYLEGMGSSILDAMASRLPVVATRTGGIPEVVVNGETGLLVPPKSPAALAKAILRIYEDRALGDRLGQKGYEVVHQKFSAEAMAAKVISEYERLAKLKNINLLA
ncbi:MAG: glycosyltransferase family 4 protein [Candidatus Aminicenantes bacterium]